MLSQLRRLEEKYYRELVVIGVHSAKFTGEIDTASLSQAVLRNQLSHPVVNDNQFLVWKNYAIRAWPTLIFIDPRGKVIGKHEGELSYKAFDNLLKNMIEVYTESDLLDTRPFPKKVDIADDKMLAFPGKLLADGDNSRLFISDTNHNRILITSFDGQIHNVIGGSAPGFLDGDYISATFQRPQGLALNGECLYVADTENNAIRKIDLLEGIVTTIAGTGEQGFWGSVGGEIKGTALNSPWDLVTIGTTLFIAMAGSHQIWMLEQMEDKITPFAGTGREGILDDTLAEAQLAQPSGITTDGEKLFFVDSETSSVRWFSANGKDPVRTLIGKGLFTFGDEDGDISSALLQHPMGIEYFDGNLYIADTFNHKIKILDIAIGQVRTILGRGEFGARNSTGLDSQVYEPGDISFAKGSLFIADTNNHIVRVMDLKTCLVATLDIRGV